MDTNKKISDLTYMINELPKGTIGKKEIKGKIYYYHRFYVNGKKVEQYVNDVDIKKLKQNL